MSDESPATDLEPEPGTTCALALTHPLSAFSSLCLAGVVIKEATVLPEGGAGGCEAGIESDTETASSTCHVCAPSEHPETSSTCTSESVFELVSERASVFFGGAPLGVKTSALPSAAPCAAAKGVPPVGEVVEGGAVALIVAVREAWVVVKSNWTTEALCPFPCAEFCGSTLSERSPPPPAGSEMSLWE